MAWYCNRYYRLCQLLLAADLHLKEAGCRIWADYSVMNNKELEESKLYHNRRGGGGRPGNYAEIGTLPPASQDLCPLPELDCRVAVVPFGDEGPVGAPTLSIIVRAVPTPDGQQPVLNVVDVCRDLGVRGAGLNDCITSFVGTWVPNLGQNGEIVRWNVRVNNISQGGGMRGNFAFAHGLARCPNDEYPLCMTGVAGVPPVPLYRYTEVIEANTTLEPAARLEDLLPYVPALLGGLAALSLFTYYTRQAIRKATEKVAEPFNKLRINSRQAKLY